MALSFHKIRKIEVTDAWSTTGPASSDNLRVIKITFSNRRAPDGSFDPRA